jgi:hypothetical protein
MHKSNVDDSVLFGAVQTYAEVGLSVVFANALRGGRALTCASACACVCVCVWGGGGGRGLYVRAHICSRAGKEGNVLI